MFCKIFFDILKDVIMKTRRLILSSLKTRERLEYQDILNIYTSGCKEKSLHTIGLEYERLPISMVTNQTVDYSAEFGVCNFLRVFAKSENWDYITDDYNIIGLKQGHDTITLEPGCQVELSVKPEKSIDLLKKKVDTLNSLMEPVLDKMGITLLGYGVSPLSTHKSINLLPKRRYGLMAKYLWGILSDVMMRETAGIQGCFDFVSEEDAVRKFKIANKLTPFVTAMFANSPIRGGVDTGYKSFRALSWLNTDNDRCGFAYKLGDEYSFDEYIDYVMNTPMIFISREDLPVNINGKITFKDFMKNGWEGFEPTLEDYLLQANLCFPEVRLRNFIEIRNQDCGKKQTPYAVLALYKGILQSESSMDEIEELLKPYNYNDFAELRYNVPKNALSAKIAGDSVKDIVKEILYISEKSLISENDGDEKYLDFIKEYSLQGITPADVIIRNWYGIWNKDIKKLVKYLSD